MNGTLFWGARGRLEIAARVSFVTSGRQADSPSTRRGRVSRRCFVSQLESTGGFESDENDQGHTRRCRVRGIVRRDKRRSEGFDSASFTENVFEHPRSEPGPEPGSEVGESQRQEGQARL